ncbi:MULTISPECIES: FAD-dependent oxidoreductase [Rhodococcus]|uniref:FAD-dependent oxidoreductase n=1 Tax=Rhodococcus TaxID=1827 RepID=UPI000FF32F96|nr:MULTISPECIES: FAD-dependent oxidoreductase [Rhodococcus]WAL46324.1 FAD-dependent oxidoreductase [Rhodococcus pyridinivorans]
MTSSLECDVLVVGGGAGALTGALTAATLGLDVILAEKTEYLGGTAAYAGAGLWLPLNKVSAAAFADSREEVDAYVAATTDDTGFADLREAYLDAAPEMIDFLLQDRSLDFYWRAFPDYYPDAPGYKPQGRAIFPKPLPAFALSGVMRMIRPELPLIRGGHKIGKTVEGGRVLLGRLIQACMRAGVRIELESPLLELETREGTVVGARLGGRDGDMRVRARAGVLLAAGGFDHDIEMRKREGHPVEPGWQMGAPGSTGEVLAEARRIGAGAELLHEAWWTPAFHTPLGPSFRVRERGHPGSIVVNQDGRRFCNESLPYDRIGRAFRAGVLDGTLTLPAWFIVDQSYVDRYGLNGVPPRAPVPEEWLAGGFAYREDTLEKLASSLGIPADNFVETVERFNKFAETGVDEEFGRGDNAFDAFFGDPDVYPNPALSPLEKGPFYALPMVLSDLGTKGGLRADPHARVLDESGEPITGLYAAGNIMASWTGSCYPGPGAPIGSSMVFGYLAARHMVNRMAA